MLKIKTIVVFVITFCQTKYFVNNLVETELVEEN